MSPVELAEAIRELVAELSMSGADQPPLNREEILASSADELDAMAASALERAALIYSEMARRKRVGGEISPVASRVVAAKPALMSNRLPDSSWSRLPLNSAILEYLKTSKKPATPLTIWAALEAAGCEVDSDTPVRSVGWALKKLLRSNDDLFHFGWGKWDLKSKYTKAQLEKLVARIDGTGGKAQSDHSRKTKAGMKKARARGSRAPGAPRKLTEDKVREFRRLLSGGDKLIRECCEAVGIKVSLYQQNKRLIMAWREGEPWPPSQENLVAAEGANVVRFSRRKKNEAPSGKPEDASSEPSKGEVSQPIPSAIEPEASHLGEPPAEQGHKGRSR